MKSCVIGGAGFIGSKLTEKLMDSGRDVVVLGRRESPLANFPDHVQYVNCDLVDRIKLRAVLKNVDEVYDLAYGTVPKTSYDDPVQDILSNLPSSVGLFEEVLRSNINRMVIVSSGGTVYGQVDKLPIKETELTNPISPYGITKLAIEKYALMFYRQQNLPVSIARPANAYGPGQLPFKGQGFIATAMGLILKNKPVVIFGKKGTIRDYIYVDDVASGILAVSEFGLPGEIYNIGSGIGRNNLEVLDEIKPLAEARGKEVCVKHVSHRQFDVGANVLDSNRLIEISVWSPKTPFRNGLALMWENTAKLFE